MPNEFVARNGVLAQNNSQITGSLTVSNGITGSLFGTASFALTASSVSTLNQNVLITGSANITGSLTVTTTGTEFQVLPGGVTIGNAQTDLHNITGSVSITGSLTTYGESIYRINSSSAAPFMKIAVAGGLYPTLTAYNSSGTPKSQWINSNGNMYFDYDGVGGTSLHFRRQQDSDPNTVARFMPSGNFLLQNAGTYADNGYKVQIQPSGSASGSLFVSGSSVFSGSVTSTLGFTGSLLGTASTASFVTTAQTASYVFQAVSASYALTASYVSGSSNSAVSASYALSSSYAATASFANSFPDQGYNFTQAVGATTWTINHNLDSQTPLVNVYDSGYNQLIPAGVTSTTANTTQITFSTAQTGYAIISKGSGISSQTAVSSSFATTASYASSVGVNFQQVSPSATWTINHNLNNRYPLVQTYGSDSLVLIPASISGSSVNTAIVTFSTPISGYARVI